MLFEGMVAFISGNGFTLERTRAVGSTETDPHERTQTIFHKTQQYLKFFTDLGGGGTQTYENPDYPAADVEFSFAIVAEDPVASLAGGVRYFIGDTNDYLGSEPGPTGADRTGYQGTGSAGFARPLSIHKWDITDFSGLFYIDAPLTSP